MPDSTLLERGIALGTRWARINGRISWSELQPDEIVPIQWGQLADFEAELREARKAGMTVIVVVDDYPDWAIYDVRDDDDLLTACGPIKPEKLGAFASFVQALVARYKTYEFNVHIWELGNEPDVDPDLVAIDSDFGCWGDTEDEYYGGRYYGEMINVVSPVIKAEDPTAQVWIGGLLLAYPETTVPELGRPELFLKGILEAGAAPNFDAVPYHWYPSYLGTKIDYDNAITGGKWNSWGGGTLGKARYLRQLMQEYGVDKPVFLNETGLGCPEKWAQCQPPDDLFYEVQADYVVRTFIRGLYEDVMGFIWYTLNGPGWRYTGLLNGNGDPNPVYSAYQQMNLMLRNSEYLGPVDYGSDIEAYAFEYAGQRIQVVWAKTDLVLKILIPQDKLILARDRSGVEIPGVPVGSDIQLSVGYSPIYIVRWP